MQQQPDVTEQTTHANPATKRRSSVMMLVGFILVVLIVPAAFGRMQITEQFDQSAVDDLQESAADFVFIGNSLLNTRIDPNYLSELTGKTAVSLAIEGTGPGVWLLQLQNIVAAINNPPSEIFVVFHDDLITRQINFTGREDPALIDRLSRPDTYQYALLSSKKQSVADRIKRRSSPSIQLQNRNQISNCNQSVR